MPTDLLLIDELRVLAYVALLSLLLWIPYIAGAAGKRGLAAGMGYPTGQYEDMPGWVQRANRAHLNMVENLAPFAALILVATLSGSTNDTTALAAWVFLAARIGHAVIMIAGIPVARTLIFTVGWLANLVIFWQIVA
ncbi:MAPEG family protein [Oceanibacterium hippocampi]|uniref:MAPEG family protein n=1 Tax=Oceanibacterium hippocampi TaxID=745714 RepID=A0A1Y5RHY3_9PROT|nr:MAPEG family protein [Oceanibacterium hippocampi]SLN17866.1 MAPEG family protein [Oceanibacterium hippocampi]